MYKCVCLLRAKVCEVCTCSNKTPDDDNEIRSTLFCFLRYCFREEPQQASYRCYYRMTECMLGTVCTILYDWIVRERRTAAANELLIASNVSNALNFLVIY